MNASPSPPSNESWRLPAPEHCSTPRRVPLLLTPLAVIASLLIPRHLGPHLARSSWLSAYTVYLVSIWLTIGFLLDYRTHITHSNALPWASLQRGLGQAAMLLYHASPQFNWTTLFLCAAIALPLLVSPLLWPMFTVGERRRDLFVRCAKLFMWSTPALALVFWVLPPLSMVDHWPRSERVWLVLFAGILWHASVLARLGTVHSGPRTGSRWNEFDPRCDRCSYTLLGQTITNRCPECGLPVSASQPDARQPRSLAAWLPTFFATIFARDFGQRCAVWKDRRASGQFLALMMVLGSAVAATLGFVLGVVFGHHTLPDLFDDLLPRLGEYWDFSSQPWLSPLLLACAVALAMLAATWTVRLVLMFRSYSAAPKHAVLVNYMSSWLLLAVALGGSSILLTSWMILEFRPWPHFDVPLLGRLSSEVLLLLLGGAPLPAIVALYLLHLRSQVRQARFANG